MPAAIQQRLEHLGTTTAPPTLQTSLSTWLRQELKQRRGQDIDPDHTYLVSLNYNTGGESGKGPYPGQVVRKQSLTEAAMDNSQAPDVGDAGNTVVPYRPNGPDIQLTAHLPIKRPNGLGDLAYRYWAHGHDEDADYTYTYEGIYKEIDPPRYDQSTQLALDPKDFRASVWTADPSKVVHTQLDGFWADHEKDYAQKARISFFGAAFKDIPTSAPATYKPGDLKPDDRKLAAAMLKQPPEPGVEYGRLTIHGYTSTDIMYARDKASGRTLLYIPGDKACLYGFDSANELPGWLASEKKDVPRRTAFATHFSAYDRQDGTSNLFSRSGVDSALAGIAAYPQDYAPPGLLWHKGQWHPDQEIGLSAIQGDPFDNLLKSTKERSYQDADTLVTSDKDVTEKNILKYLNIAGVVLGAVLAPLSAVGEGAGMLTHVVAGLDASAGIASIGIGLDERSRSKPGWADDVINGAMQIALAGTPKLAEKLAGGKGNPARKPADGKAWPNKPFFNLPQRFNQQIGYPLGPKRPPRLDKLEKWQRENVAPSGSAKFAEQNKAAEIIAGAFRKKMATSVQSNMMKKGTAWPHTEFNTFSMLSRDNYQSLVRLLSPLRLYEKDFLDRLLNAKLHIVHATDRIPALDDGKVSIFSRQKLKRGHIPFNDTHTGSNDIAQLASDDHVFFSLEHGPELAKKSSRFGTQMLRFEFEHPAVIQQGLMHLGDLLPFSLPDAGKYLHDLFPFEGPLHDEALRGLAEHKSLLTPEKTVFHGPHIKPGLALAIIDRARSMPSDVARNILENGSLNELINGLYRPQILVPRIFVATPTSIHPLPVG